MLMQELPKVTLETAAAYLLASPEVLCWWHKLGHTICYAVCIGKKLAAWYVICVIVYVNWSSREGGTSKSNQVWLLWTVVPCWYPACHERAESGSLATGDRSLAAMDLATFFVFSVMNRKLCSEWYLRLVLLVVTPFICTWTKLQSCNRRPIDRRLELAPDFQPHNMKWAGMIVQSGLILLRVYCCKETAVFCCFVEEEP
jgi:hypothetical protein